jgi:hypothetical protein
MSTLIVSSINGSKTTDPAVSTLAVNGSGFITLEDDPGTTSSAPIFFKTGNETISEGILEIRKSVGYTDPSLRPYTGLAVEAFSTLGALQPVICGSLLINPTPNVAVGAPISGNSAGDILFPMSSIVGISTINGAPLNSFSTINVSTVNGFPAFPAVINRSSGTPSTLITASTFATAQTIATVTISTLFAADVDISATFTTQTTSAGTTDVYYYCTQGGVAIGTTAINTTQGNNHYATCPAQATALNLAPSTYTFGVKVYTPNGPGELIVTQYQLRAIGHLL